MPSSDQNPRLATPAMALATGGLPSAPELTLQERIAAINRSQCEINASNLRDIERQKQLLAAQRTELDARWEALEARTRELSQLQATADETTQKWSAAQRAVAEAENRLASVAERERNLQQQVANQIEREIFPECLLAAPFQAWRAEVLRGAANTALLRASVHFLTAAFQAGDPEELCRALAQVGRQLYRSTSPQTIDEIARTLNGEANNRYSLRVAHAGEPTEKSWMSFSGIASVNAVHGWAVLGPDRLKRFAAEVS